MRKETKRKVTVSDYNLWRCSQAVCVEIASHSIKVKEKRKLLIELGEIVEFRYHHSIHFRTEDDVYCVLKEEDFYNSFVPHGKIFEDVRFMNRCNLSDILKLHLFHTCEGVKEIEEEKVCN